MPWTQLSVGTAIGLLGVGAYALGIVLAPTALTAVGAAGTVIGYGAMGTGAVWVATSTPVRSAIVWSATAAARACRWIRTAYRKRRTPPIRVLLHPEIRPGRPAPTRPSPGSATPTASSPGATSPSAPGARPPLVADNPLKQALDQIAPILSDWHFSTRRPALAASSPPKRSNTMSMESITGAITGGDTFVPVDGPDTQRHLEEVPDVLRAFADKIRGDIESIGATLPQFADSLALLATLPEAVSGMADQADELVAQWRESAAWVWQGQN